MRVFLSFHYEDENPEHVRFVQRVYYMLRKQAELSPYCYTGSPHNDDFRNEVGGAVSQCDHFVLFLGGEVGGVQEHEAAVFRSAHSADLGSRAVCVRLPGAGEIPDNLFEYRGCRSMAVHRVLAADDRTVDDAVSEECAAWIFRQFAAPAEEWIPDDGLPVGYPFQYEKDIAEEFGAGSGLLSSRDRLTVGCPQVWPKVPKTEGRIRNPVSEEQIGYFGDAADSDPRVVAAALGKYHGSCLMRQGLTLPEARPRQHLCYPIAGNRLTVGLLVSGGIAPGINAVISGIVQRQHLYAECGGYSNILGVLGYFNGFHALLRQGANNIQLDKAEVAAQAGAAGSLLGTSRAAELMDPNPRLRRAALVTAVNRLRVDGINILYVIGGDGSMRAAHALWRTARGMGVRLSVVAVPKTMDNDILWVWQAFGFMSAVERAKQAISQLHTEAKSNPRLCIVQLFGSDSGFVVSQAALASGVCDLCLIPEVEFKMSVVSHYVRNKLLERYNAAEGRAGAHGMVVMAETAIPLDIDDYLNDKDIGLTEGEKDEISKYVRNNRRVYGQTPDELRSGGLKVVMRVLQRDIKGMIGDYWQKYRVFSNEPRHLIRAIPPSCSDIIIGQRLGSLAVDCAMAGYEDFMISQWLTEYVMVPLQLVTLGRKRVPPRGIFWASVRASTGQPASLTD